MEVGGFAALHSLRQVVENRLVIDESFTSLAFVAADDSAQNALGGLFGSLAFQLFEAAA